MIELILLKAKGFHIVNYAVLLLILYIFAWQQGNFSCNLFIHENYPQKHRNLLIP